MFDALKNYPKLSAMAAIAVFLVVVFMPWIATIWPVIVRDKTIPEWLSEFTWIGRRRKKVRARPAIEVTVSSGTTSHVVVRNVGDPFTLVTRAQLVAASPGVGRPAPFQFLPRQVSGGDGHSSYTVARLNAVRPLIVGAWVVQVHGEHMEIIQQWEGFDELWFEVEWVFQLETDDKHLETVATVITHLELSEDTKQLVATKKDTSVNAGQMTINTGAFRH